MTIAIGSNAPNAGAVVLQVGSLVKKQVNSGLKTLLEDSATIKILFNVDRAARWLHGYGMPGVKLANCMDLQLLCHNPKASLRDVVSELGGKSTIDLAQQVVEFNAKLKLEAWTKSPLAPHMLATLVRSMHLYTRCYSGAAGVPGTVAKFPSVYAATSAKWSNPVSILAESSSSTCPNSSAVPRTSNSQPEKKSNFSVQPPTSTSVKTSTGSVQGASPSFVRAIKYITSNSELKHLMEGVSSIVGVHIQFTEEILALPGQCDDDQPDVISIVGANPLDTAIVLQLDSLDQAQVFSALKTLFANPATVNVMHDFHRAAFCLHRKGLDVELRNCIDLQVAYENIVDTAELHASMLQIVEFCKGMNANTSLAQTTQSFKAKLRPADPTEWAHRPLPESLLRMVANNAQLYAQCYVELAKMPASVSCGPMSNVRWQYAIENQGHQAIWFDLDADNQPRNLEYFASYNGRMPKAVCLPAGIPTLQLQCELESLLDLLPIEYEDAILAIDDYHNKLVDICLDVGRIPYVYTGKKQRVMLSENGATVTKEIIEEIITNLGGEMRIGDDNRAGIDRQLHRISVMRTKTDEVYGLTMRVGRALRNAACVLTDLLLSDRHADKSVLVLGHPGSGKTTLIRDVARCVSETMENVCIIDTSNEIGGDGLVPHECVGWAGRMMVPSLEAQAGVMVECVQNHTVETLIVDEIGRKAEVLDVSTVRQRGPRLIASAHGDFRALIKNPDLKGLVGGSQQVIVGDKEAKASNQGKLQTQRAGNPIFDVIVELDHVVRGRCRIIWDVAKAVDNVLEGNGYPFETRRWDASAMGVQVLRGLC
ncbi:hypothetical protein PC129_g15904 [Phytophthora cactorum]|uniref:AAA+ ATPase domain-containing protein n=2 Tax=Phytophthora cactorum TaxID=29920 RepID=A0A8T1HKC8_9STRA|nr:hypothetical protein C6341_g16102 [Phytophthora cactorum]KAG3175525.1 hypothetical protein PC128_g17686 [Phytophthora cactorum]KAG3213155.1 hypothetical protein PC129_g15904 [Phytophthora cactorum]